MSSTAPSRAAHRWRFFRLDGVWSTAGEALTAARCGDDTSNSTLVEATAIVHLLSVLFFCFVLSH